MMRTQLSNKVSVSLIPGLALFLTLLLILLSAAVTLTWLGSPSYALPLAQPLAQTVDLPEGITANDVNGIAQELWCPLCSGVRLDVCELKACDQMKDMIAIKLSEGDDLEVIQAYFIEQYGPQVLGEPPKEGFNWLAWIMPFAMLAFGGAFLWFRARTMVTTGIGLGEASDREAQSRRDNKTPADDDYESKLEEELNRYV